MPPIRFRSRHLLATFYNDLRAQLGTRGWVTPPINFGTAPLTFMDYQPDERNETIKHNTVAVTLGDYGADEDEELGARGGGLNSALYNVFIDVYMAEQALSLAICDDVRDIYIDRFMPLVNQIDQTAVPAATIEVQQVLGPERPGSNVTDQFRRYWRTMRIDGRLYYQS